MPIAKDPSTPMEKTSSSAVPLKLMAALAVLAIPAGLLLLLSIRYGWSDLVQMVYAEQRQLLTGLSDGLAGVAQNQSSATAWGLVIGSAIYGLVHAAGPGHGKVIMTTYLLTSPEKKARALLLSVAAAFCQGLVAIIIVYGIIFVLGETARSARAAALWSERLSYALVAAMGAWLIWRTVRQAWNSRASTKQATVVSAHSHHHDHAHEHVHGRDHAHGHGHNHASAHSDAHAQDHHHHHDHDHDEHCGCGHAHAPSAEQVESASDWRTSLGVIASIGFRPCTGAVLVLVLAKTLGIAWAGVASVLAMSAGTATAICLLAMLAVWARESSFKLSGGVGEVWTWTSRMVAILGGATLIALGLTLLSGAGATRSAFGI